MTSSNCCILTHIQVSRETGKMIWHSHLFFFFLIFFHVLLIYFYSLRTTSKNKEPPGRLRPSCFSHPTLALQSKRIWFINVSFCSAYCPSLEHPSSSKDSCFLDLVIWMFLQIVESSLCAPPHCGLLLFTFWLESHRRGTLSLCSSLQGAGGPSITLWPDLWLSRSCGVWHSHLLKNFPQFAIIHIVKDFLIVNEAGVDVFLQFPCFFYDPVNDDNLISGFLSSLNQICPSAREEGN